MINISNHFFTSADLDTFCLALNEEPTTEELNTGIVTKSVCSMIRDYCIHGVHNSLDHLLVNKFLLLVERFKNHILLDMILKYSRYVPSLIIFEECTAYILHKVDISNLEGKNLEKAIQVCININYPIHHLLEILPEDSNLHDEEFRAQFHNGNIDTIRDPKFRLLKDEV